MPESIFNQEHGAPDWMASDRCVKKRCDGRDKKTGKMKKNILILYDREGGYVSRLADFMNRKNGFLFEVYPFTDRDRALRYRQEHPEAVLLSSDFSLLKESGTPETNIFLSENLRAAEGVREAGRGKQGAFDALAKYQPADELIRGLLELCGSRRREPRLLAGMPEGHGDDADKNYVDKDDADKDNSESSGYPDRMPDGFGGFYSDESSSSRVIGIYSPVGRCGKTGFALCLGEILAERQRTLYLNMEELGGFSERYLTQEGRADITDLIYYLREDPESIGYRLAGVTETFRKLDYIAPALRPRDLFEVRPEEWVQLVRHLAASQEYEVLLLDIGGRVQTALELLPVCRELYMPAVEDESARAKVQQFMQLLLLEKKEELQKKIIPLLLPEYRMEGRGLEYIHALVKGRMGEYVRRMLRRQRGR